MTTVDKLLSNKGNETWTIGPQASVYDAIVLMSEKNVGALLVVDSDSVVGIITERDYARKLVLQGRLSRDTVVSDVMTAEVLYVEPINTTADCMVLMTNNRIRHLPVLSDGELVGIVTIGDVVKHIISEQESTIAQLEKYITGIY